MAATICKEIAVPAYQDIVHPSAKHVGKTIEGLFRIAFSSLNGITFCLEKVLPLIAKRLKDRLCHLPPDEIIPPPLIITGPVFNALMYTSEEPLLCELYANLLASAMHKTTKHGALPAYVDIIKQLSSDDAKLLKLFKQQRPFPLITVRWEFKTPTTELSGGEFVRVNFSLLGKEAGLEYPAMTPKYLNNLCRLGLIEIPQFFKYTTPGLYEPLENEPEILEYKRKIEENLSHHYIIERKGAIVTEFGKLFISNSRWKYDGLHIGL